MGEKRAGRHSLDCCRGGMAEWGYTTQISLLRQTVPRRAVTDRLPLWVTPDQPQHLSEATILQGSPQPATGPCDDRRGHISG